MGLLSRISPIILGFFLHGVTRVVIVHQDSRYQIGLDFFAGSSRFLRCVFIR